jgi:flagellar biosynthesis GTPase FlhF
MGLFNRIYLALVVLGAFSCGAVAQPATPTGLQLVGAGPCKLYPDDELFRSLKSVKWAGPCVEGVADGLGQLEAIADNNDRLVWRQYRQRGRRVSHSEDQRVWRNTGDNLTVQSPKDGKTQTSLIAEDQIPTWARRFILSGKRYPFKVVVAGKCKIEVDLSDGKEEFSWNGPCENGRAHGLGVLEIKYKDGDRGAWRQMRASAGWREHREDHMVWAHTDGNYTSPSTVNGKRENRRIKRQEVPEWAQTFLYAIAADTPRVAKAASAEPVAPLGQTLMDAGNCRIFHASQPGLRSLSWRGHCLDGLAEGEGFLQIFNADGRVIMKVTPRRGIHPRGEVFGIDDHGDTYMWSVAEEKFARVQRNQVAYWAQSFLDAHPPVAAAQAARQSEAARQRELARQSEAARETEAARQSEAEYRRREEDREDRLRQARENRRKQEESDREFRDTMNAIHDQARRLKQQQDENLARREADRQRIERDNERYRQMRAEQQRAEAERTRINASSQNAGAICAPSVMQVTGRCYHDGVKLDVSNPDPNRRERPSTSSTSVRQGQR